MTKALRPVLGDQLSRDIASLADADPAHDVILMMEVMEEAVSVGHHKKKIAFIFSAMRHFAQDLEAAGFVVDYVKLDDPTNTGRFTGEIERALARHQPERLIATEASEWRVRQTQRSWISALTVPVLLREDDRFLASHRQFEDWAGNKKQLRMEYFYREMRRRFDVLMTPDGPEGGLWNYDHDNRKPARDLGLLKFEPPRFAPDAITKEVLDLVGQKFAGHFGALEPFWFATTAAEAEQAAEAFFQHALARFGNYQDAMLVGDRFLYHSVISMYLNVGLLKPLDLVHRAEAAYQQGLAPLNAVEGYIRQIMGWREFVRGIYWLKMPDYVRLNAFNATRPLPEFYWTGNTKMACVKACVSQTHDEAYAHHIQRLMVTGNFALLAGIDPHAVHEWYLAVYADAFEWVELPNTLGMSQFGDGGIVGSKPYAASGAYIDRMSDYCAGCSYDVHDKAGPKACPFNVLYWDFLLRNKAKLAGNPRMAQMYRTWDKMDEGHKARVLDSAAKVLDAL